MDLVLKPEYPTQKPLELLEYLIRTYTRKNETVLDNTMGSGSTGVACVNTNRNFGLEKALFDWVRTGEYSKVLGMNLIDKNRYKKCLEAILYGYEVEE